MGSNGSKSATVGIILRKLTNTMFHDDVHNHMH